MSSATRYTQACMAAADVGATGTGLIAAIREVMGVPLPAWIAASDVDPSGSIRSEVFVGSQETRVFRTDEYLRKLERAEQIVWASLFFCTEKRAAESISGNEDYTQSLAKADFAVRVVDAGTYYFYGPSEVLDPRLVGRTDVEITRGDIGQLDFPE